MIIKDDFLSDPEQIREAALAASFKNVKAYDGEVYERVAITDVKGLQEAVEAILGPVLMLGMGYRLNYAGELPNNAVHVDVGWGTHALVLYLSERKNKAAQSGTAFWKYVGDGNPSEACNDMKQWQMEDICPEKFNRAVIFRSDRWHSRWPLDSYGTNPEDGRLIAVAFFTPLSEL